MVESVEENRVTYNYNNNKTPIFGNGLYQLSMVMTGGLGDGLSLLTPHYDV